ncbi:MAG: beta-ketoacyl synthase N-terminal-like domain-containing protein, partial [Planctomycetota bacterium]|nr:beta-ketoacyl synthase N-terminal-like domain-containing protein [Planctomycetota bacterium]
DKVDAIGETPPERWSNEELYDPKPGRPGKLATKWGGFLENIELFDAAHFGIAAREASRLDPQQRILLETVWEALEDAAQSPDRLRGTRSGVFLGTSSRDYLRFVLAEVRSIDGYSSTGNASSVSAGRVNYVLDWNGPSLAIDTACSSSLVALHQARRALLNGECDLALAAGTHLTITPAWTISFSHAHMMAADGRCKTFDAAADGYVRGEGCGVIVMKRLSDAIRDRDDIVCTIRGSAVNHDGASNGITAPNGHAQELVIRAALQDGGVEGRDLGYVEAHGTGTPLGDPIECTALSNVVSEGRTKPLPIGSVKTNIGHLEPSAGIAGLIKAALALQRETIPPQIHFRSINPRIPIDEMPLEIAAEAIPWPRGREPRFAGVSSFGFAGTNAHIVLEEAPLSDVEQAGSERPLHVLCLSGRTEEHVPEVARRLSKHLDEHPDLSVTDVCFTENTGRAHLAHRIAFSVASSADLRAKLAQLAAGAAVEGARRGEVGDRKPGALTFVFPSAEGIDPGAGRELVETQPAFRRSMDRCREVLAELGGDPEAPGPAAFALAWSLGELLRSFGLEPDNATGSGVGRNVAEVFRGERTLEEGLKLAIECGTTPGVPEEEGAEEVRVAIGSHPTWEWSSLVDCLADLHVRGVGVDWEGFEREYPRRRLHLPTYPFERKPYWFKPKK